MIQQTVILHFNICWFISKIRLLDKFLYF